MGLMAVQISFFYLQKSNEKSIKLALEALLNQERVASNPYSITQGLENLESLDLIRCSKLYKDDGIRTYLDTSYKGDCHTSFWHLNGLLISDKIKAINGVSWRIDVITNNSLEFTFLLWSTRTLVSLLLLSLYFLYQWRLNSLIQEKTMALAKQEMQLNAAIKISDLASQVSHDIRSPLLSLKSWVEDLESIPSENRENILGIVSRINDIASDLLNYRKKSETHSESNESKHILISTLIDTIIAEKKAQLKGDNGICLDYENLLPKDFVVNLSSHQLGSALSNIINNSCEALDQGTVRVLCLIESDQLVIKVSDNGKGIPANIISKLGTKGFSYDKNSSVSGTGLGLYQARMFCEEYGGELIINSIFRKGTEVILVLPIDGSLNCFDYVYLDNDKFQRLFWSKRAKLQGVSLLTLSSCEEFYSYQDKISKENTHIYLDSDFGEGKMKGEEFALHLNSEGYLHLRLATAFPAERFSHLPWLNVCGKDCPF